MSDETIDLLDINVDDAYEPEMLPKDSEVKLRVEQVDVRKKKEGEGRYLNVRLSTPDNPRANDVFAMFGLPNPAEDDEKTSNNKKRRLKEFCLATDCPTEQLKLSEFIGKEFYGIIGVEEYQGNEKNTLKKIVQRA